MPTIPRVCNGLHLSIVEIKEPPVSLPLKPSTRRQEGEPLEPVESVTDDLGHARGGGEAVYSQPAASALSRQSSQLCKQHATYRKTTACSRRDRNPGQPVLAVLMGL